MAAVWNVDDLEITGYADVLKETMLPSVVPPVFRLKNDPGRAFLPPYSLNAGYLCNATEVGPAELEALKDAREITLFDRAFAAQRDHDLWVDPSFGWHYQPRAQVEAELSRLAGEAMRAAETAFLEGKFDAAERLCAVAISADDRRIEPLVLKAAIHRKRGNRTGEALMAELASRVLGEQAFRELVDQRCGSLQEAAGTAPSPARRPMHQAATCKASAA